MLVGWTAAQAGLGFDGHPAAIHLRARESAVDDVRKVLPRTINPARPGSVDIGRPSEALAARRITQNAFSGLLFGLAAIALRTEIGLRRALGANQGQIRLLCHRISQVSLAAGDTVLESALKAGLEVPYACLGGACGTCKAKVLRGSVAMEQNFALPPAVVEAGYGLTCQSHPTTPSVTVDYDA